MMFRCGPIQSDVMNETECTLPLWSNESFKSKKTTTSPPTTSTRTHSSGCGYKTFEKRGSANVRIGAKSR